MSCVVLSLSCCLRRLPNPSFHVHLHRNAALLTPACARRGNLECGPSLRPLARFRLDGFSWRFGDRGKGGGCRRRGGECTSGWSD